jgi:DNA replication protein DnaC
MNAYKELRIAELDNIEDNTYVFNEYQLTNAQLFIKNLFSPHTLHKRLLINWQTGVGKSLAAISIGNEFIKHYQLRVMLGEKKNKFVYILGFSTSETIQSDLLF